MTIQRVCVFCGSKSGNRPLYSEATHRFGQALAARGYELVFGAGHVGFMGVLADAVLAAGGKAIGVIPQALVDRELAHGGLTELRVVETMHQRKALMADLSDAFVALPGGYGTGDELFEIMTWAQLGIHAKPIGLLNTAGYFEPMLAWLDHMVQEDFLRRRHRDLLVVADDSERLLKQLEEQRPQAPVSKWISDAER